jgi:hypothetical protein
MFLRERVAGLEDLQRALGRRGRVAAGDELELRTAGEGAATSGCCELERARADRQRGREALAGLGVAALAW